MNVIRIRALKPCDTETYKKRIDGYDVIVRREQFDDWNDLEIELQDGVELPQLGKMFDLTEVAESYSIIDISSNTHIEFDELSDIPDEIREQVDEAIEEDDFSNGWEIIGETYLIDDYRYKED